MPHEFSSQQFGRLTDRPLHYPVSLVVSNFVWHLFRHLFRAPVSALAPSGERNRHRLRRVQSKEVSPQPEDTELDEPISNDAQLHYEEAKADYDASEEA